MVYEGEWDNFDKKTLKLNTARNGKGETLLFHYESLKARKDAYYGRPPSSKAPAATSASLMAANKKGKKEKRRSTSVDDSDGESVDGVVGFNYAERAQKDAVKMVVLWLGRELKKLKLDARGWSVKLTPN